MRRPIPFCAFILTAALAFCQDEESSAQIIVPKLELFTLARQVSGQYELGSRLDTGFDIQSGKGFSAILRFGLNSSDVESDLIAQSLDFTLETVALTVEKLGGLPLSMSYFVGKMENFCSGEDFPSLFGTANFASEFRGYWYFPDGVKNDTSIYYDGIYRLNGTGLRFTIQPTKSFQASAYLYQDATLGAGRYSGDLRLMADSELLKVEIFGGYSLPANTNDWLIRGGILSYTQAGTIGGLLVQVGIPYYAPNISADLGIEQFYFLIEPRFFIGDFSILPTFFYHPAYYNAVATGEDGMMDFNTKFRYVFQGKTPVSTGIDLRFSFDSLAASEPLSISLAPFLSIKADKTEWKGRVVAKIYTFDADNLAGMFACYFGVNTEF
jgi:hypothetical protein